MEKKDKVRIKKKTFEIQRGVFDPNDSSMNTPPRKKVQARLVTEILCIF